VEVKNEEVAAAGKGKKALRTWKLVYLERAGAVSYTITLPYKNYPIAPVSAKNQRGER